MTLNIEQQFKNRVVVVFIALAILPLCSYPWLFMEPNALRFLTLPVGIPMYLVLLYVFYTGDLSPLKFALKKLKLMFKAQAR